MKAIAAITAILFASVAAAPVHVPRQAAIDEATIARLAPDLGAVPPLAPTGFGDCQGPVKGADGKPASVPCSCPPTRAAFIEALTTNVLAGKAVNNTEVKISFPTSDSVQDQLARITASAITLQNLVGPGKGCPLVATTLGVQAKAIQAGGTAAPAPAASSSGVPAASSTVPAPPTSSLAGGISSPTSTVDPVSEPTTPAESTPVSSSSAPAPASTSAPTTGDAAAEVIAQLAPDLGVTAPLPPTGRGDCQGPVKGTDGQPISVPCQCPPAQDVYITALTANVIAGKALNNTEVAITFPTGSNVADKQARINAAVVTLQNLVGPGKGCPLSSTTLGAQRKALEAGQQ